MFGRNVSFVFRASFENCLVKRRGIFGRHIDSAFNILGLVFFSPSTTTTIIIIVVDVFVVRFQSQHLFGFCASVFRRSKSFIQPFSLSMCPTNKTFSSFSSLKRLHIAQANAKFGINEDASTCAFNADKNGIFVEKIN